MASNKKSGNAFERQLCDILCDHGFWAHNLAQNSSGQPADVVAVKNKVSYLIDCKVCSRNKFQLDRIEDNQHCAMEFWQDCGNGVGWFALKLKDESIWFVSYDILENLSYEKSELNAHDIMLHGISLGRWLKECS